MLFNPDYKHPSKRCLTGRGGLQLLRLLFVPAEVFKLNPHHEFNESEFQHRDGSTAPTYGHDPNSESAVIQWTKGLGLESVRMFGWIWMYTLHVLLLLFRLHSCRQIGRMSARSCLLWFSLLCCYEDQAEDTEEDTGEYLGRHTLYALLYSLYYQPDVQGVGLRQVAKLSSTLRSTK